MDGEMSGKIFRFPSKLNQSNHGHSHMCAKEDANVRNSELLLELLENRIVLDGTVDEHVEGSHLTDAAQADGSASSFDGDGVVSVLEVVDYYDGQWHEVNGWLYQRLNGFDFWYAGTHYYYAMELATGYWFWYDDLDSNSWEPCWEWYYDYNMGAWVLNGTDGSSYYYDEDHYFYQDHNTEAWLWWDSFDDFAWESAFTWFYDFTDEAWIWNDWNLSCWHYDADHYLYQEHDNGTWFWWDSITDSQWEPYQTWFTGSIGAQVFNDWDSTTYHFGPNGEYSYVQQHDAALVNLAPEIGIPGPLTGSEDTELTITGIAVLDVDAAGNDIQVTLSVEHGSFTLHDSAGLHFTVGDGSHDAAMVFTGNQIAINNAVSQLVYQGIRNFNGADTLVITIDDLGHNGSGGAHNSSRLLDITVNAVNDAPLTGDFDVSGNPGLDLAITGWIFDDSVDSVWGGSSANDPDYVTIVDLPNHGVLYLDGTAITQGQVVSWTDANAIIFVSDSNWSGYTSFHYTVTETNGGMTSNQATARIAVHGVNLVEDIRAGDANSDPSEFTVFNGDTYFSADDGIHGYELWKFNSTGLIELVSDINPGENGSYPTEFTVFDNALYFSAYNSTHGYELWKIGSNGVTSRVTDINTLGSSNPADLTIFNGSLYFTAYNGARGTELWKLDTNDVLQFWDIRSGNASSDPTDLTLFNSELYFSANDGVHGTEVWKLNGSGIASRVTDINMSGGSSPQGFTVFENGLYFSADDGTNGAELWKIDSNGAASLVRDVYAGPTGSWPLYLTVFNDVLYFSAYDTTFAYELWMMDSDGVASRVLCGSYPLGFTVFNNALYFSADDGVTGNELWKVDSTGTASLVADINPLGSSAPEGFIVVGDSLYFCANDGTNGEELWKMDSNGAVSLFRDINPSGSSSPDNFAAFNNALYFSADDGVHGNEFWIFL
jgi:ELWxxDGT repeat protein